MIRRLTCFVVLALVLPSVVSAEVIFVGDPVFLSDLIGGDPLTVGDKVFTGFTYLASGDVPDAGGVNVQGINSDGNFGLRFHGAFVDLAGGGGSDALISFTVSVAPGSPFLINDVHLAGNPDVLGGIGLASVTETFLPTNNPSLSIFSNGSLEKLMDWADLLEPVTTLQVQKDINLLAGEGSAGATISFIDQTFSQIPEPTGLTLLGVLGLIGMGLRRRT